MTTDEKIDRLTPIAASSLDSINALEHVAAAHTEQIQENSRQIAELGHRIDQLTRDWRAYLTTIHPRQCSPRRRRRKMDRTGRRRSASAPARRGWRHTEWYLRRIPRQ